MPISVHHPKVTPLQRKVHDEIGIERRRIAAKQLPRPQIRTARSKAQHKDSGCIGSVKSQNLIMQGQKPTMQTRCPGVVLEPGSSAISQDQLAAEVKGIYAGLVMVEAKCIETDTALATADSSADLASEPTADLDSEQWKADLDSEQWKALIALHRTLLYEHHDFLIATQHPSAHDALRGLATKYSMPARMWKHGIHAFLEVLRHRRPASQDYMLAFIYLAYQMMALLYETVDGFKDTWIECLGDLARYRMAIEEDKEQHTSWGGVAARWYTLASDRHPAIGRLNHYLGILERPSVRKMFFYAKSLTCLLPFSNAKDSMATLCNPILQDTQLLRNSQPAETRILHFHNLLFSKWSLPAVNQACSDAHSYFEQENSMFVHRHGVPLAVANIAGLLERDRSTNGQRHCFAKNSIDTISNLGRLFVLALCSTCLPLTLAWPTGIPAHEAESLTSSESAQPLASRQNPVQDGILYVLLLLLPLFPITSAIVGLACIIIRHRKTREMRSAARTSAQTTANQMVESPALLGTFSQFSGLVWLSVRHTTDPGDIARPIALFLWLALQANLVDSMQLGVKKRNKYICQMFVTSVLSTFLLSSLLTLSASNAALDAPTEPLMKVLIEQAINHGPWVSTASAVATFLWHKSRDNDRNGLPVHMVPNPNSIPNSTPPDGRFQGTRTDGFYEIDVVGQRHSHSTAVQ